MEIDRPLSSLELTALGILLKRGPCVAHAVVAEFAGSQTFAYRSGAGSIYPLLKRLTAAGLLNLSRKKYSLTDKGRAALKSWLVPPFPDAAFSTSLDVLRSRAYFLKLLTPEEIAAFADHCHAHLETLLANCKKTVLRYQESGDRFSEMAMIGAVRETEARLAWIAELKHALGPRVVEETEV